MHYYVIISLHQWHKILKIWDNRSSNRSNRDRTNQDSCISPIASTHVAQSRHQCNSEDGGRQEPHPFHGILVVSQVVKAQ